MSSRPRRSSTRPTSDAATATPAAPAAAAASTPAASPALSTAASSAAAAAAPSYTLSTKKLKLLRSSFESALDSALAPASSTSTLLAALPRDLHARHALVVQRQAEKVLASIRKNCLNEFEVILSEHRLPEKLGEVELLELQNQGVSLDAPEGPTPTPEQAVRNMLHSARTSERARLQALADSLDAENTELRTEIQHVADSLKNAKAAVTRKQQYTDQVYEALERESRQSADAQA
jgi:hypothetical protein